MSFDQTGITHVLQLPKSWRAELIESGVQTGRAPIHDMAASPDGTTKLLLKLFDGRVVETVNVFVAVKITSCCRSHILTFSVIFMKGWHPIRCRHREDAASYRMHFIPGLIFPDS